MESSSYVDLFREHVPAGLLKQALAALYDCYAAAGKHCGETFQEHEAGNIRPFYRRGLIEQSLREIAKRYKGVVATAEKGPVNENGQTGWWSHTLIRCGPISFTQNAVSDRNEMVRPSYFRQVYAAKNPQLLLFDREEPVADDSPRAPREAVKLYGILLHGQSAWPSFPDFAVIRFPSREYDGYLPGVVDLFREFPAIVANRTKSLSESRTIVEQVAEPTPQLRAERGVKGEGA
jgi:hypothetical protein